jgi:hypothetical protein
LLGTEADADPALFSLEVLVMFGGWLLGFFGWILQLCSFAVLCIGIAAGWDGGITIFMVVICFGGGSYLKYVSRHIVKDVSK